MRSISSPESAGRMKSVMVCGAQPLAQGPAGPMVLLRYFLQGCSPSSSSLLMSKAVLQVMASQANQTHPTRALLPGLESSTAWPQTPPAPAGLCSSSPHAFPLPPTQPPISSRRAGECVPAGTMAQDAESPDPEGLAAWGEPRSAHQNHHPTPHPSSCWLCWVRAS